MKANQLTPGIHAVRISDSLGTVDFNLSVVQSVGMLGVAAFKPGQKIPARGKHLMLSDSVRNWIGEMELVSK